MYMIVERILLGALALVVPITAASVVALAVGRPHMAVMLASVCAYMILADAFGFFVAIAAQPTTPHSL